MERFHPRAARIIGTADIGTFCIYCQKEYETSRRLNRHIARVHEHTYAYWASQGTPVVVSPGKQDADA